MRRHQKTDTVWGGETITWLSNAVPISLFVKTDNLVDRKVKFSLNLPPHQKTPNENQNKKQAKIIEGNSLNTSSHYNHDGICRLRVDFSHSSEYSRMHHLQSIIWWQSCGHPGTEPTSETKEFLWLDPCWWVVPWMNNAQCNCLLWKKHVAFICPIAWLNRANIRVWRQLGCCLLSVLGTCVFLLFYGLVTDWMAVPFLRWER